MALLILPHFFTPCAKGDCCEDFCEKICLFMAILCCETHPNPSPAGEVREIKIQNYAIEVLPAFSLLHHKDNNVLVLCNT
jgi:hypothetical protein